MPERPHFDISAAVVRQLGDELVSDEVTALIELVKNAYDADANYAHVVVNTTDQLPEQQTRFPGVQGYITIEDDGMGMDRSDIVNGWLMISLSGKRVMKAAGTTTPKGRTPLGDKGLGRLSTQKLGQNLELITRKDGTHETNHVSFAWAEFTDEKSLGEVPVIIEPATPVSERTKGTLLAITGLRNPSVWRGGAVDKLIADLSQILSPFSEARPFLVTLRIDGRPIDLGRISDKIRDAAAGKFNISFIDGELTITGKVRLAKLRGNQEAAVFERYLARDNGKAFFEFLRKKSGPVHLHYSDDPGHFFSFNYRLNLSSLGDVEMVLSSENGKLVPANPGPFHGEIDDFLLRGDESGLKLGGLTAANEIQKVMKLHAGIKIFRDGFAVKPYGINGEDWLRLGAQQTSASSWYGLRPHNVIGFVAISESKNRSLKEKTDREGFVSNPYSQNFRRLMIQAASVIGDVYEFVRRSYNQYRSEFHEKDRPFQGSRTAISDAEAVATKLASYEKTARSLETRTTTARGKILAVTTRIKDTPLLSSAVERQMGGLLNEAREALDASQSLFSELDGYATEAKALADIVSTLSPRLDVLSDQLQDFAELAGLGLLAETLSHEIQNQTDRLMHKASAAIAKARKSKPVNTDVLVLGQEVTSAAAALRKQIGHLAPSLRYQRDKIEVFSIGEMLQDIEEYFKDRTPLQKLSFVSTAESCDFSVRTNRGRLNQVIDNILLNSEYWMAQAASKDSSFLPEISLDFYSPRIRIWDNAGGVDPAVENSLFEPFVTLKPKEQGRGLGLFLSNQILESMGCSLSLLDTRNGQGRRFVFELDLSGISIKN